MRNLAEMLAATAARKPEEEAIIHRTERLTWNDLMSRAASLAHLLREHGLCRTDVVAIFAPHSPAQVVAMFATAFVPTRFTIVSPLLRENQVKHQISDCNARAIIGTPGLVKSFEPFFESRGIHSILIEENGILPNGAGGEGTIDIPFTIPADVCSIIYTSGSTGKPKGVVLPGRTLLDGARIVSGYLGITEKDTLLSMLPYHFDYGLNQLLTTVYRGARIVQHDFRFPNELLETLDREKITGMAGVPSLWPRLFDPKLVACEDKSDFPHLRYVTTAGGAHSQDLLRKLSAFFPKSEIIVMYGLTESFRSTYLPYSEIFKRPGSIGRPVPEVEILVVNEEGRHCEHGEIGELIHRGAFVSYGYLNNPDLTEAKFIKIQTAGPGCLPENAVRSGDLVSKDEEGFLYFHGRKDSQIKIAGYRLSPSEVEEAALQIPDVCHAAVFALTDSNYGECVCLAYTTYSKSPIAALELRSQFAKLLPTYAVPKQIFFHQSFPLTSNGKIDYVSLKAEAAAAAQPV